MQQEDKKQITVISRKKTQTLTFKQPSDISIDKRTFSFSSLDLYSSEYTLTPQLRSSTPSTCDVKDRSVTLISVGICTLVASQPGNNSVSAANEVSISFNVIMKKQTLTFKQPLDTSINEKLIPWYLLQLSSSEYSLTPVIRSTTSNICEVKEKDIMLLAVGVCTLTASQAGNDSVMAASDVSVSFNVLAGKPMVPIEFSASRRGTSITYSIGGNYDLKTKFDVSISPILSPNAEPTKLISYYGPAVWRIIDTQTFSITRDEINTYYNGIILSYPKYDSTFVVRVRASNEMGVSDWNQGIYTSVRDIGLLTPTKTTITCVKGKLTKKVTAVKPVCPQGYKKK